MMATSVANRLAALGLFATAIAERSGAAAAELIEHGVKPPIGSGHPAEAFIACGIGAAQLMFNTMMPPDLKMRIALQFQQMPHYHAIAMWENDAGDRRVVTLHSPEVGLYLTICQGTPNMQRPIQTRSRAEAKLAHNTLCDMVRAGQL